MSDPARPEDFELESLYDFTTFAPTILGTFRGVRVKGIIDHQLAFNFIDPAAMHANVYSSLPQDQVPDDFRKYSYLVLTMPNDQKTAVGLPWIERSSVEKRGRGKATIVIDDVASSDLSKVQKALSSNGFKVSSVELND